MRFYIKSSAGQEITGPFDVEELNQLISDKKIDSTWRATSDLGESLRAIQCNCPNDWFWVAEISGVTGVEIPKAMTQKRLDPLNLTLLIALVGVFLIACFIIWLRTWLGHIQ